MRRKHEPVDRQRVDWSRGRCFGRTAREVCSLRQRVVVGAAVAALFGTGCEPERVFTNELPANSLMLETPPDSMSGQSGDAGLDGSGEATAFTADGAPASGEQSLPDGVSQSEGGPIVASAGQPCDEGSLACGAAEGVEVAAQVLGCVRGVFVVAEECMGVCALDSEGEPNCSGECRPGDTRCVQGELVELCDTQGNWFSDETCVDAAPRCVNGQCLACAPGERQCSAAGVPEVCEEDGSGFAALTACSGEPAVCVPETGECGECSPGSVRACVGALGNCAAGQQLCGDDAQWGPCSIQPALEDDCEPGDDATCNGTPNEGCGCTADTACGPAAIGLCQPGVSACVNGEPSACVGAVQPQARDCASPFDNDCDGTPDNTADAVCQCAPGTTQACDTHPGLDGIGACRAGTRTCVASAGNVRTAFTQCVGSVGPRARDCRSSLDNDCDGVPDNRIDDACQCVPGETRDCGEEPGSGGCAFGTQTCQLSAGGSQSSFGACVFTDTLNGSACDDGDSQTVGDSCQAGTCEGIRSGTLATSFAGPCAIRSGGDVYCWGNAPTTSPSSNGAPSRIDLPLPAVSVSVGGVHACAVLTDGSTRCWGSNQQGTLGNGTLEPVTGAVRPDLANVVQVDSSPFQTAALTGDGTVSLWGAANAVRVATNISLYGSEAPPSSTQQVTTPFPIARLGQVVSLGLGQSHMCAALSNGQVVCWGRSDRAQLGRPSAGGEDVQPSPGLVDLAGADDATAVDVGEGYSCALRASGRVVCWGSLFATDLWGSDVPPTEVPGLSDAIQVSVGAGSACALRSSRTVACWGSNLFGSLGNGTFVDSESAQPVANLTDAVLLGAASASARSFCALRSGGQVVCWGANSEGALGDGTTTNRPTPVPVLGLPD